RHHGVGVLDPGPQLLDAYSGRLHDRKRRAHRRQLVGSDLQPLISFPLRAYAARLGNHRGVPGRRAVGVAAAEGARRCERARHAALRRAACRGAGAAADPGRRPARPQHARAPAGEDRGDGSAVADAERRAARAEAGGPTLGASPTAYIGTHTVLLIAYMVTLTHMARK